MIKTKVTGDRRRKMGEWKMERRMKKWMEEWRKDKYHTRSATSTYAYYGVYIYIYI